MNCRITVPTATRRVALGVAAVCLAASALAAEVKIALPLGRTAYQTNEVIDLAVTRSAAAGLAPGDLALRVAGADGSRLDFTFPVGGGQRRVEHLKLDARLLRPGDYTLTVAVDGSRAEATIDLHGHIRRTEYRIANWGGSGQNKDAKQWSQGEDNLGFNLMLAHYAPYSEYMIRAGVDFMRCCTMSGGHQMDLRMECDWSDPYVTRGGRRRMAREAFSSRTRSNAIGVHAYDEPGLTWWKDPETGQTTAHMVPPQVQAFEAAFGRAPLRYNKVDPNNPQHVADWSHWAKWKLAFMDAAWQEAQFAVSYIKPGFMTLTQSQYGFSAFTDGYYFNVVRSLPVTSGHGGYHDWGPGYYHPGMTLEIARARDWAKPCWYLPTWYGNTTADQFRLEQYLSFQTNIQGLMAPPPLDLADPSRVGAAAGIVESNKVAARLGPIFNHMPVTRPPVAMLFSLSHNIHHQATRDMDVFYTHQDDHGANFTYAYLAGKLTQYQFLPIVDEDVADGTLAANHKALILTSIDYLDPAVVSALTDFIASGGLVLKTTDSEIDIPGIVDLGVTPGLPRKNVMRIEAIDAELAKGGLSEERKKDLGGEKQALAAMRGNLQGAKPLAAAIGRELGKAGIRPILECNAEGIAATRQAEGDIEYLFAVNATHDYEGHPQVGLKAADATISLPDDGRPVYDAMLSGPATQFAKKGGKLTAAFRFGPGAMRVWARTTRPIGSVRVGQPAVRRDYTVAEQPIRLAVAATLLDDQGGPLSAAVPLRLRVTDPLGGVRYDLYRATENGVIRLELPLAVNDPPGQWTVTVQDLLAGTTDTATFAYAAPPRCATVAGAVRRAVSFGNDRRHVYRFFRVHQDVTLVVGSSDYNAAAAERLTAILSPWNVRCRTVSADAVNKPRSLTEAEAATWVGIDYRGKGQIKPGDANDVATAGFAVEGPVVLLGTPEDNPLIAFAADKGFLPYPPDQESFPGPQRGYLAWQYDAVGVGQESITLIAFDVEGMSEAVGSLFEAQAGLDPLTTWTMPATNAVAPANAADIVPEGTVAWQIPLGDRVDALGVSGDITVVTHDGAVARISATGRLKSSKVDRNAEAVATRLGESETKLDAALQQAHAAVGRVLKKVALRDGVTATACWGGYVQVADAAGKPILARQFQHDVGGLAWAGDTLVIGLSDGRVVGLAAE